MFLVEPSLDFSVQPQCSQCLCSGISGGETQPPRHRGHGGGTEKQQIWINLGLNHVFWICANCVYLWLKQWDQPFQQGV